LMQFTNAQSIFSLSLSLSLLRSVLVVNAKHTDKADESSKSARRAPRTEATAT
jgi:hypothetical protein